MFPKSYRKKQEVIFWLLFLAGGMLLSNYLMQRDFKKGFGSLAYGAVPYFEFKNSTGEMVNLHKLKGKVWLVNFVSDAYDSSTARALPRMHQIHQKYTDRHNFRLITISDNSERIGAIKNKYETTDLKHWYFLNGSQDQVQRLMKDGFLLDFPRDAFALNNRIFLVDQNATIRGFYTLSDQNMLPQMEEHLNSLL